jgi:hypothetical protein
MNVPMNVPSSRRPLRILTYKFRSRFRRQDSARHSSDAAHALNFSANFFSSLASFGEITNMQ